MDKPAAKKRVSSHKWRKGLTESFKERLMQEMERIICQRQKALGRDVSIDEALDSFAAQIKIDRKLAAGIIWSLVGQERLEFHNDFSSLRTTPMTRYCPKVTADKLARVPRPRPA